MLSHVPYIMIYVFTDLGKLREVHPLFLHLRGGCDIGEVLLRFHIYVQVVEGHEGIILLEDIVREHPRKTAPAIHCPKQVHIALDVHVFPHAQTPLGNYGA